MPVRRKKAPYPRSNIQRESVHTPAGKQRSLTELGSRDCGGLFTIYEALENPQKCREKCDGEFWEEKVMEPLLKEHYNGRHRIPPFSDASLKTCLDESALEQTHYVGIQIARAHRQIAKIVLETFSIGFLRNWKEVDLKTRRAMLGEVIGIGTRSFKKNRSGRPLLPDITLALAEGDNLLDLLKQITYSGIKYPKSDNYLPIRCEKFEFFYRLEEPTVGEDVPRSRVSRSYTAATRNARNLTIVDFVFALLITFEAVDKSSDPETSLNEPDPIAGALVHKPRRTICSCQKSSCSRAEPVGKNEIFEELYNGSWKDDKKKVCRPSLCQHPGRSEICRSCRRYADEIVEFDEEVESEKKQKKGSKFSLCQPCRKIGRSVTYCSEECQLLDWETHKVFCGKKFVNLGLPFAGEQQQQTPIVSPLPSFSLQRQIYLGQPSCPVGTQEFYTIYKSTSPEPFYSQPRMGTPISSYKFSREADSKELERLLEKAIETRLEEDLQIFVEKFAYQTANLGKLKPYLVAQIVRDWEVSEDKVEKWVANGIQKCKDTIVVCLAMQALSCQS